MDKQLREKYKDLSRSPAGAILADYLRERLLERQRAFTLHTKETFEVHKGRCLELDDLLRDLTN